MNFLQRALVATASGLVRAAGFGDQAVPPGFGRADLDTYGRSRLPPKSTMTAPESYGQYTWPYVGTAAIAEAAGTPPFAVLERANPDAPYETADPSLNGVAQLYRPNEWCSPFALMEATSGWLSLTGNAYWLLVPNELGGLAEIWVLDSRTVQIVPGKDRYIDGFLVTPRTTYGSTQGALAFTADEVVHFKLFNPLDPFYGLTPLQATLRAIESGISGEDYNLRFFINDATPGGFLTRDEGGDVSEQEAKRIRAVWRSAFGNGTRKRFRTAALWGGWRYEQVAADHKDIAFADLDEKTQDKVLAVLGVPPAIAGQYRNLNFATAQVQKRAFWTDTVVPVHNRIGDTLRLQYLPLFSALNAWDFEADPFAAKVEWDYTNVGALTDAILEQEQAYDLGIKNGSRTINEVRAARGDGPVPWGNAWWGPLNQVELASQDAGATSRRVLLEIARSLAVPAEVIGNGNGNGHRQARLEPVNVIEAEVVPELTAGDRYELAKSAAIAEVLAELDAGDGQADKLVPSLGDDERRKILAKQWLTLLRPETAKYERQYDTALRKSAQRTLDRYRQWIETHQRDTEPDATKGPTIEGLVISEIYDVEFEAAALTEALAPQTLETALALGQAAIDAIGLEQELAQTAAIEEFATSRAELMGLSTADTTGQQLSRVIAQAQADNATVRELERAIASKFRDISEGRAKVIARTETASSGNFGLTQGWAQSGVVVGKEWIWSFIERETHDGINGTTRLPDGVWVVGQPSTTLRFPVDPMGSAAETINCGCTMAPVLDEAELERRGIAGNPLFKRARKGELDNDNDAGAGERREG